jgi:hypothetical protein
MAELTKILGQALDMLLVNNPVRTSLGVVLGCSLEFLSRLFEPALRNFPYIDLAARPWWGWMVAGILVMHIPTLLMLFRQKTMGDEELDRAIALIERGNFAEPEKRRHFRELVTRATLNIGLTQKTQREVEKFERRIKKSKPSSRNDPATPPDSVA